ADIAEALSPHIAGVVLPKLESLDQLVRVRGLLAGNGMAELRLLCGIESASGVSRCEDILDSDMLGAYFGAEDYIADLGGVRTADNTEVLFARSRVALACRLAGIPAVDQIVTNIDDAQRFRIDAAQGRSLGFKGKMCIHPAQVTVANEAFTPNRVEVDRARRLLDAYQEGIAKGSAAIRFEGEMIDEPLARQARLVVLSATEANE
ncbi:MAG: CoA ester lyase, partial [Acidimicrobiales bacterium]